MRIARKKHRLDVSADLSGSVFDDVNLSGLRIDTANLAGTTIVNGRLEGMTIEGIQVIEMHAFWRAAHEAKPS